MKKAAMALLLGSLATGVLAEGHYVPGVEGMKGPSAPPLGSYYVGYLVNYGIDSLRAPGTDTDIPGSNKGNLWGFANRFVHMTKKKVLGADYGLMAIIPVRYKSFELGAFGYEKDEAGIGDLYVAPLVLGWHGDRWDGLFAAGYWFDSAASDEMVDPGNGYASTMLTAGGTAYLTGDKGLFASAMLRYEFHHGSVQTPGGSYNPPDQATLEWGIGKKITPTLDLGLVGYSQWQTTKDTGTAASSDKFSKHALGVELSYRSRTLGGSIEAAYYQEYDIEAGTRPATTGDIVRLNINKPF